MSKYFRLIGTPTALKHGELAVIVSENLMFLQHMATSFCSIPALSTQIDYFLAILAFCPIYFVGSQSLFLCFLFKDRFFFFPLLMEIEQCAYTVKENFELLLHKTDTELRAEAFYKEEMEHTHYPGLGLGAVVKSS